MFALCLFRGVCPIVMFWSVQLVGYAANRSSTVMFLSSLLFCGPGGITGHVEQHCAQVWHHTQRAGSAQQAVLQSSGAWPGVNRRAHLHCPSVAWDPPVTPPTPQAHFTASPFCIFSGLPSTQSYSVLHLVDTSEKMGGTPSGAHVFPPTFSEQPADSLTTSLSVLIAC